MATHVWPGQLPDPVSYSEEFVNLRQEFIPDVGHAKIRSRVSSAGEYSMQLTYLMTGLQVDDLREFYYTTTKGGAESFGFHHPQEQRGQNSAYDQGTWKEAYIRSVTVEHEAADLWRVEVEVRVKV